jgi:hypothetical protein
MRIVIRLAAGALVLAGLGTARANPFPDERAVPKQEFSDGASCTPMPGRSA